MYSQNEAMKQWPHDKVEEYLDKQHPNERVEWIVLDESGLYGLPDPAGSRFACTDDDENRVAVITRLMIRNGGTYILNARIC